MIQSLRLKLRLTLASCSSSREIIQKAFMKLSILKTKCKGSKIFEGKELIPIALSRTGKEHESVFTAKSRNKLTSVTLLNIQEAMVKQFRIGSNTTNSSGRASGIEGQLLLHGGEERKCHTCGKKGNFAKDCNFRRGGTPFGSNSGYEHKCNGLIWWKDQEFQWRLQ